MKVSAHFVTFLSPGTFLAESTTLPIDSWDVNQAKEMASTITERYDAVPYGFYFTTRERGESDLDSKQTQRSSTYYLHGKIVTLEEIKAKKDPNDSILISNMECNHWNRVVQTTKGWRWTLPLYEGDVVFEDESINPKGE
jgi:hypothetical protein